MLALTPVVLQLVQLGITVVPGLLQAALIEVSLVNSSTAPTAAQQAAIDAALDTANATLQNAQPAAS